MSTVLLIQADLALSRNWSTAIESAGHTVISARSMDEGVRRVREGGIDIILLDHWDREEELFGFVDELERLPDPPPIVLISDSPRAPEISAHLGVAAFLPKPCHHDELVAVIRRFGSVTVNYMLDDDLAEPRTDPIPVLPG